MVKLPESTHAPMIRDELVKRANNCARRAREAKTYEDRKLWRRLTEAAISDLREFDNPYHEFYPLAAMLLLGLAFGCAFWLA